MRPHSGIDQRCASSVSLSRIQICTRSNQFLSSLNTAWRSLFEKSPSHSSPEESCPARVARQIYVCAGINQCLDSDWIAGRTHELGHAKVVLPVNIGLRQCEDEEKKAEKRRIGSSKHRDLLRIEIDGPWPYGDTHLTSLC